MTYPEWNHRRVEAVSTNSGQEGREGEGDLELFRTWTPAEGLLSHPGQD